jgi:hypothetical protein
MVILNFFISAFSDPLVIFLTWHFSRAQWPRPAGGCPNWIAANNDEFWTFHSA